MDQVIGFAKILSFEELSISQSDNLQVSCFGLTSVFRLARMPEYVLGIWEPQKTHVKTMNLLKTCCTCFNN